MTNIIAAPQCFVEIYPYEGGQYQIQGGQIITCKTRKSIGETAGRFEILLAPGGPRGTNTQPSWTQVITPMSFVLIGMRRWQYANITMIGVVDEVAETQVWTDQGVVRAIRVKGRDFGAFFEMFNYVALSFLGGILPSTLIEGGVPAILGKNYLTGRPDQIATNWYNTMMVGASGVLANTNVNWNGQELPVGICLADYFQPYPAQIPYGTSFATREGSWINKLKAILNWPVYETFVTTAPVNQYPAQGGTGFTMQGLGALVVATPFIVGRLNPTPLITGTGSGGSVSLTGTDSTAWNALQLFQPDSAFIENEIAFSMAEARNFYMVAPTWFATQWGGTNSGLMSWTLTYGGLYDATSIHRYGFRPEIMETEWFTDVSGSAAQQDGSQLQQFALDVTLRMASWHHPQPLMARAMVQHPLRPDVLVGNRFRYAPFKGTMAGAADTWDFYIEAIEHNYAFGRKSTTTMELCRGLPSDIYADGGAGSLLFDILTGNAERIDGDYLPGNEGGAGLQGWGISSAQSLANNVAQYFTVAQKK